MNGDNVKKLCVFLSGMAICGAAQAELLVNQGVKGTLSVQYEYSSVGNKPDKYEPKDWRVQRTFKLVVPMKADLPSPAPALHAMDAAYTKDIEKKKGQVKDLHQTMAPAMDEMMKIAARCDEDEACIEKAIKEYSTTMDRSTIEKGKAQATAASTMGGPRYQVWQPVSQKGTYEVDEIYRGQTSDPLCVNKPNQRCTREEIRKGGGAIPPPAGAKDGSIALIEVDSVNKDIVIRLPAPMNTLTYTRQVKSDFPDEKSGTTSEILPFMHSDQKPVTFALPGDLRGASGTQTFKINGAGGEGGTMKVTWQFAQQ